jgi:DNA-binding NarL/FixJ family response regulator
MSKKQFNDAVNLARLLSPRQKEVLKALAEGAERKEIAEQLKIAESTVANHLQIIYARLNIHNAREATRLAVEAYRL